MVLIAVIFHGTSEPDRREPPVAVVHAIALAKKYVEERKFDLSGSFVDSVVYVANSWGDRGAYWRITWERSDHVKGGQVFVNIYMDRRVAVEYGE